MKTLLKGLLGAFLLIASNASAGEVAVTTGDRWLPYTNEEAASGGFATAIVKSAIERLGHSVRVDHYPWARSYELAKRNQYLGTFPWYESDERREDMLYSDPFLMVKNVVFVRNAAIEQKRGWADVNNGTLCRPTGYTILPAIQQKLDSGEVNMVRPPSMEICMKMLARKRADYVITGERVGLITIRALGLDESKLAILDTPVEQSGLHFLVAKANPDAKQFLDKFNDSIRIMKSDGTYDELLNQ